MVFLSQILLLPFLVASRCHEWRCRPLPPGLCAEWTPAFVWVNTEPCPSGLTCSLLDVVPRLAWSPSGVLKCTEPFLPHNSTAINCRNRNQENRLAKTHPAQCEEDTDCEMENGALGRCGCGLDGTSYCKLSEGDPELDGFYASCESMSGEAAFAWYMLIDLGHMLPRLSWCVKSRFEEITYLVDFLASRNLSAFLQRPAAPFRPLP